MRIAYVCADRGIPVFGRKGSSIHVQEVIRALLRCGVGLELFSHRLEGEPPPGLEEVVIHQIPGVDDSPDPAEHGVSRRDLNESLHAALQSRGPFAAVYERYSLWSFAGMEYARELAVPGLLEVNAPLIDEQAQHRELRNRRSAEEVATRAFCGASLLLAVSDEVAQYLRNHEGIDQQVHVVPNAVDPSRFPARPHADSKGCFTVGFLGSLRPWHGLQCLAEAFALIHRSDPASRLLVVGDGPEREKLVADLERLGIVEACELTGAVAPEAVPMLLDRMDVAVSTVSKASGFYFSPLKVFEYMAAGLPVVASPVGQLVSIIEEGRTGFFCPPGDAGALAAVLERLRADPELRLQVGQAARATVLREHTWDGRVRSVFALAGIELG